MPQSLLHSPASIPWVEKYRPSEFGGIILDKNNRTILENVIRRDFHVNMLFYGPPGTGKTTTIINMIKRYNKRNKCSSGLVMHLNASDDRGIELIRNQLYAFVNTSNLFTTGKKIIVLDEADYMTKLAQQALKLLIEQHNPNIRFIIICNYITKIDKSLQNIMMHMRFNNLPKTAIIEYLQSICRAEGICVRNSYIERVQQKFDYDIRSMINYIQFNFIEAVEGPLRPKRDTPNECEAPSSPPERIVLHTHLIEKVMQCVESKAGADGDADGSADGAYRRVKGIFRSEPNRVDVRMFWIELFCRLLKMHPEYHVHAMKIKYFVNNMCMTDDQIITHGFYLLREIRAVA